MTQIRNAALAANLSSDFYGNWGDQHARTVTTSVDYDAGRHPVILSTGGALGITITLPDNATNAYKVYWIKKVDAGAGSVTVDAAGADTIDGAANVVLANQYDSLGIVSDGAGVWHVIEPAGWGGGGGKQYATFVIAASDTTADGQALADYVCDGVADDVEIAAAIAAVTPSTYRRILLLEGTYYLNAPTALVDNMVLEGQGEATVLYASAGLDGGLPSMFTANSIDNIMLANFRTDMRYSTDSRRVGRGILMADTCTNIWLQNIHNVDHYGDTFRLYDCSDVLVEGCVYEECYNNNLVSYFGWTNTPCQNLIMVNNIGRSSLSSHPMFSIYGYGAAPMPDPEDRNPVNVVIAGNEWRGAYGVTPSISSGQLCEVFYAHNVTISGNVCNWCSVGYEIADVTNCVISGNTASYFAGAGITVSWWEYYDDGGGVRHLTISDNAFDGGIYGDYGIFLEGPQKDGAAYPTDWRTDEAYWLWAAISGNSIANCNEGIYCVNAREVQITGNMIRTMANFGIDVISSWSISMVGNWISDCGAGIIVFGEGETDNPHSDGNLIEGNYISRARQTGVYIYGAKDNFIKGNLFYECVTTNVAAAYDQCAIAIRGAAANGIPKRNTIQGNMVRDGAGTHYMDYIIYNCGTGGYEPEGTLIKDNDFRDCSPILGVDYDCGTGTIAVGNLIPSGYTPDNHWCQLTAYMDTFALMIG